MTERFDKEMKRYNKAVKVNKKASKKDRLPVPRNLEEVKAFTALGDGKKRTKKKAK